MKEGRPSAAFPDLSTGAIDGVDAAGTGSRFSRCLLASGVSSLIASASCICWLLIPENDTGMTTRRLPIIANVEPAAASAVTGLEREKVRAAPRNHPWSGRNASGPIYVLCRQGLNTVGVTGFEPATPSSRRQAKDCCPAETPSEGRCCVRVGLVVSVIVRHDRQAVGQATSVGTIRLALQGKAAL
jgi:hypothetical protein